MLTSRGIPVCVMDHDNETNLLCGQHQPLQTTHMGSLMAGPGNGEVNRKSLWLEVKGEDILPSEGEEPWWEGC